MHRTFATVTAIAALMALPATALAGHGLNFDHAPPGFAPSAPPSMAFNSGGKGAEWDLIATFPTTNPHTDLDFFTSGGDTYGSFGALGAGANGGGQEIFKLTEGGQVAPQRISFHPSATCVSNPEEALALQHDVEAAPKGGAILNTDVTAADRRDTQLLIDATDGPGRCHDQGVFGVVDPPQGGLEIIDVTDPAAPVEIGLTSHIGEAHTVNVDPRRPHIAYAVTSDRVIVNDEGVRANEDQTSSQRFNLDGFEVVDMSSCMNFPAGASVETKRAQCRPEVYRYRYPSTELSLGHTNQGSIYGCHELEIYPDDRLTCASGAAMIALDMKGAFDDRGTPTDFSDDKPRGTPLNCAVRDSTSVGGFSTGAKITDCVDSAGVAGDDLAIPKWLAAGAPSLTGVSWIGSAFHAGRESTTGAAAPAFDATEDIDFDHEAELTHSGRFVIATDERGGGVSPPGASCTPAGDAPQGNGGLHAYRVDKLLARRPTSPEDAFTSYARNSEGDKAIHRVPINTQPQSTLCTAHVFQQIPGQNRIFMGWYSQGTQVVDYVENADGTFDFKQAGYFIPESANEWVSHIFKVQRNPDETFTYFGAASDFELGSAGRGTVDIYKVTLPAPPRPAALAPGVGSGFKPPASKRACLSRKVKIGPRNIGRLKLGQTRARTTKRARPLGSVSRGARVLRYCIRGKDKKARALAVFNPRRQLRLTATDGRAHRRKGVDRGTPLKAVRRRFGKRRLRRAFGAVQVVRGPRSHKGRTIFVMRRRRVRHVVIADRRVVVKDRRLRSYLRRAGLVR